MRKIVDRVVSGARAEVRRCQLQKQERMGNNCHRNEKKGYNPTAVQCSNKWKQLKKSFVEVEDNKRTTGRGKKSCKFYNELGNILGFKPGVNPVSTASNSGRGEITEEKSQVKNEGTGEEETEDRTPTKKRKRSDSGRPKASGEAILKLMEECREERKAREERQFAF